MSIAAASPVYIPALRWEREAADPDWRLHACLESLRGLGVDALVTIGGDDTAFSASRLAEDEPDAVALPPFTAETLA